jgi:hypothetical protein
MNHYGVDVAIDGNLAVVGSSTPNFELAPGSAYVYDFTDPQNITSLRLLSGTESMQNLEKFGQSVAVAGTLVFVGAPNANSDAGVVHMFNVADPQNVTHTRITAFDQAPQGQFGWSLAVDGNRLIVGSPDFAALETLPPAVYVLDISNPSSITQTKIVPDPTRNVGRFGEFIDLEDEFLIVGDFGDETAYLYDLSDSQAILSRTLNNHGPASTDNFGWGVAVGEGTALVSAQFDFGLPGPDPLGVFVHDFSNWSNIVQEPLTPPGGLGRAMAMEGDLALIQGPGGVAVYDFSDPDNPLHLGYLTLPNGTIPSGFGSQVDFDGRTAIIAAPQQRAAYLFAFVPEPGSWGVLFTALAPIVRARRIVRDRRGPH